MKLHWLNRKRSLVALVTVMLTIGSAFSEAQDSFPKIGGVYAVSLFYEGGVKGSPVQKQLQVVGRGEGLWCKVREHYVQRDIYYWLNFAVVYQAVELVERGSTPNRPPTR